MAEVNTISNAKKFRFFHFRNWLGMPLAVWLTMLARNRFAVTRLGRAVGTTFFAGINSVLYRLDQAAYSRRVGRSPPPQPPVFVVGHWRTGSTLLHELFVLDEQFSYPTTYQVMVPHHFLLTERILPAVAKFFMPRTRPMDDVPLGPDLPQEDEFALCNLGLPSPYLRWAFPNHYKTPGLYLDIEALSEPERQRWLNGMLWFVRRLSWSDPRRLVLKSPTHTARLRSLSALFPGAKFVHIVRDPRDVFASTVHTWKQIWDSLGFQAPCYDGIEEYVLASFVRMYECFERDRPSLDARHLVELRYEDLLRDPIGEMQKVYERLELANFDRLRPKLAAYFAARADYQKNRHQIPDEYRQQIAERWRGYIDRYGYDSALQG